MDLHLQQAYQFTFEGLNILECGSHTDGSETKHFRSKNTCYYIEANQQDYEQMKKQPDVKQENLFCFALSDKDGEIEFTVTSHPGNSSINHTPEHIDELKRVCNSSFRNVLVPSKSYASFLKIIGKPIDILILDIEGGETLVLQGMKHLSGDQLPRIICIEAGYDWMKRKQLLVELGYTIDYYDYNNVVAHHSSFPVEKNSTFISKINAANRQFVWHGKLIYENDLV